MLPFIKGFVLGFGAVSLIQVVLGFLETRKNVKKTVAALERERQKQEARDER